MWVHFYTKTTFLCVIMLVLFDINKCLKKKKKLKNKHHCKHYINIKISRDIAIFYIRRLQNFLLESYINYQTLMAGQKCAKHE